MRIGKIEVTQNLLDDLPGILSDYLGDLKIIRREDSLDKYAVTVLTAECDEFDNLAEGEIIPYYLFTWHRNPDGSMGNRTVERL